MRLIGYCIRCRRIRQVKVTGVPRPGSAVYGICRDCEAKGK